MQSHIGMQGRNRPWFSIFLLIFFLIYINLFKFSRPESDSNQPLSFYMLKDLLFFFNEL
jgi:hypothetical protein